MRSTRRLSLRRDALAELGPADMSSLAAGEPNWPTFPIRYCVGTIDDCVHTGLECVTEGYQCLTNNCG